MDCEAQPSPISHEELATYEIRLVVAGSRGYEDYDEFSTIMHGLVKGFYVGKRIAFVSGKAPRGADAFIIRWCIENGYPWAEFPAKWDDVSSPKAFKRQKLVNGILKWYNANAGFWRNEEMAVAGNRLVTFYDAQSKGTADMIRRMIKHHGKSSVLCILIDTNR